MWIHFIILTEMYISDILHVDSFLILYMHTVNHDSSCDLLPMILYSKLQLLRPQNYPYFQHFYCHILYNTQLTHNTVPTLSHIQDGCCIVSLLGSQPLDTLHAPDTWYNSPSCHILTLSMGNRSSLQRLCDYIGLTLFLNIQLQVIPQFWQVFYYIFIAFGTEIFASKSPFFSLTLEYITKRLSPIGCCVGVGNEFGNISFHMMNWRFVPNSKREIGGLPLNYN